MKKYCLGFFCFLFCFILFGISGCVNPKASVREINVQNDVSSNRTIVYLSVWLESESAVGIGVNYDFDPVKQAILIDSNGKKYTPLYAESVGEKGFSGKYLANSYKPAILSGKIIFPMVDRDITSLTITFYDIKSNNVYGAILPPFSFSYEIDLTKSPILNKAKME